MDAFSRKVAGWAMRDRQKAGLVQAALALAVATRAAPGAVLHSDQGSQYTAAAFARQCARAGVKRSTGSAGSCCDNAMAESLFATLERELLQRAPFASREQAELEIFRYLEGFYNRKRRHAAPASSARGAPRWRAAPASREPIQQNSQKCAWGPAPRHPPGQPQLDIPGPRATMAPSSLQQVLLAQTQSSTTS